MLAMVSAILAVPMTLPFARASVAFAQASSATLSAQTEGRQKASTSQMPCHQPAQPCPHCPPKGCPDMAAGACLVKCFQAAFLPADEPRELGTDTLARLRPAPSQVKASSLIPPLLRPPSV